MIINGKCHRVLTIERMLCTPLGSDKKPLSELTPLDLDQDIIPLRMIQRLNYLIITDDTHLYLMKDRNYIENGRTLFPLNYLPKLLDNISNSGW